MPTYQFACLSCGQPFEKRLRMSQAGDVQTCPSCKSQNTRKRISKVALAGVGQAATSVATRPSVSPFS